nr:CZB domain-containing protein [Acidovorax sp. KKS102]
MGGTPAYAPLPSQRALGAAPAGNAGAALGINLDTAIQAHANWRAKLRTAVTQKERLDAETVGRDDCCELGQWLHGAGSSQYGGKPSFVNLLGAHRQFHEEAGKVARMINQGAYDHAEKQLANDTAFSRASQKVATAVIQLAKELKVRLAGSSQAAAPRPAQPVALASAPRPKVTSAAGDDDWESF